MSELEDNIRRVKPYVPVEQPSHSGAIRLDTDENPYPPSPGVDRAVCGVRTDELRLYPDAKVSELVDAIAGVNQVRPEQVFVAGGADDVLSLCFLTFFNGENPILFPDITYPFYKVWAELYHIPYKTRALNDAFEPESLSYMGENGGVVLANPNAITGVACSQQEIEEIIKANKDAIVLIDEAYVDFGEESLLPLLNRYRNLVLVRTLSKSHALAGMRVGYALASPERIQDLIRVRSAFHMYPMDQIALAAGVAAILDVPYLEAMTEKIIETREHAKKRLAALGFFFTDSRTNFLLVAHKRCPAKVLFEDLQKREIYVRHFDQPRLNNFLRITIGTDAQMEMLYTALGEILEAYEGEEGK